jgi:tetratricopeptide (TPR) repeat protein
LPDALSAYKQAYDLDPNHIEGKLDLANVYYQSGQPEKAYPLLEAFTKNYEQHPQAARLLGHVLLALDQHVSAEPVLLLQQNVFLKISTPFYLLFNWYWTGVEADPESEPESFLQKTGAILTQASKYIQTIQTSNALWQISTG